MSRQCVSFRDALEKFSKEQLIWVLTECNLCREDREKIASELKRKELENTQKKIESCRALMAEAERILENRRGKASQSTVWCLEDQIKRYKEKLYHLNQRQSDIERTKEEWIIQATK